MALAMSTGVPTRRTGYCSSKTPAHPDAHPTGPPAFGTMWPGQIALTRIRSGRIGRHLRVSQ